MKVFWIMAIVVWSSISFGADDKKTESLHQVAENVYQIQRSENLYFIFEKIDRIERLGEWEGYQEYAFSHVMTMQRSAMSLGLKDAFETFKIMFNHLGMKSVKKECELWVAYASDTPYDKQAFDEEGLPVDHIELAFAVGSYPEDRFQVHMGIARNPAYMGEKHANISIPLHSFAAAVMKLVHPNIKLMVTKPADSMRAIMVKAFENTPEVYWEKSQKDRMPWAQEQNLPGIKDPILIIRDEHGETLTHTNEHTSGNYRFLTSEMSMTPYFGVNLQALAEAYFPNLRLAR